MKEKKKHEEGQGSSTKNATSCGNVELTYILVKEGRLFFVRCESKELFLSCKTKWESRTPGKIENLQKKVFLLKVFFIRLYNISRSTEKQSNNKTCIFRQKKTEEQKDIPSNSTRDIISARFITQ